MMNKTLIKELRQKKGWTQEILADKCNISVRTIQRLESGEDGNLSTLNLIAQAFDVKVGDLFESIGNQNKEKDIINYDLNQDEQIQQRLTFNNLYNISKIIFILIMLGIAPFVKSFGLLWSFMWPIEFFLLKMININWFIPLLDKRYPLTKGINLKHYNKK